MSDHTHAYREPHPCLQRTTPMFTENHTHVYREPHPCLQRMKGVCLQSVHIRSNNARFMCNSVI